MARDLKWWVAVTLLACSVVGLVYLPPRGNEATRQRSRGPEPPTPFRLRERALAARWRATSFELSLLELRERLRPDLARRRTAELPSVVLAFDGPDTLSAMSRRFVAAELDAAWSRLGLGVSKVSVAVVLRTGLPTARLDEPSTRSAGHANVIAYLLPDSADRSTCVVLLGARYWYHALLAQQLPASNRHFTDWLQTGLGPCAFYAAFGHPGREIGRWLGARGFDLALSPSWNRDVLEGPFGWRYGVLDPRQTDNIACLAGREERCRVAVLAEAGRAGDEPHVVTTEYWWLRQRLLAGDHYLADMVREIGRERFQSFWNSELSVETALAAALRKPVGAWTANRQRRLTPPVRLGPAAPPSAALLGLLLAGVAVGLVTRTISRREVR
ncbi:MAG: hypothetical protein ACREMW_13725 [Gemmatimonadales bacterium]